MFSKRLLAVATLAVLVAIAACGGKPAAPTPSPLSGVRGIVLFSGGPAIISPSPLPGGFGTTKLGRPYDAMLEVKAKTGPRGGDVVFRIRRTPEGVFTVTLPPGTYVLTPLVPRRGPLPMPTTVVVKPGEYARAVVYVSGR